MTDTPETGPGAENFVHFRIGTTTYSSSPEVADQIAKELTEDGIEIEPIDASYDAQGTLRSPESLAEAETDSISS